MQSFYFEDERGFEEASTELFAIPGASSGARDGPRKKLWKSEGGTKMAASPIDCIFIGSRGHLDDGYKILKKF